MQSPNVIIHERLGDWARQLKPRFRGTSIRWSETRSKPDLIQACTRSICPILVVDLGRNIIQGLEDLDAGLQAAPATISLVLDARSQPGVASLARELGATLVISGVVVPPDVVTLIHRWLPIAHHRAGSSGWSFSNKSELEIWEHPDPLAAMGVHPSH